MTDSPIAKYLVPLRRWWWILAGLVAAFTVLTWVTLPDAPPMSEEELAADASAFRATHLLIRNDEAPTQLSFDLITLLARQGDLTNRIADRMGEGIEPVDVEMVELIPDPNTDTLSITTLRPSPSQAVELAEVYGEELVAFLDERTQRSLDSDLQSVEQRLEEVEARLVELEDEVEELPLESTERRLAEAELDTALTDYTQLTSERRTITEQRDGMTSTFVTLEEPTPVPFDGEDEAVLSLPDRPLPRFALMIAIAMLLGFVIILGIDYLDTRVRTRRQAEEAFGLPVIAELPHRSRRHQQRHPLPALQDPGGVTAEVLRALRLSIGLAPTWHLSQVANAEEGAVGTKSARPLDREPRSLVITSTLTGDGKSTLAANLAVSMAEGGKRALVVDCDFRRPAVGRLLHAEPGLGLRELAQADERPLRDVASPTIAENVAMVRSGSRGVTPSWFMSGAAELVRRCEELADVVIFDTGPITLTNEASALLPHVDTALIVARAGKVATDQARGTIEQLTQVGAHVSGVVLVGSETRRRYGYGYYQPEGTDELAEVPHEAATGSGQRSGSIWSSHEAPQSDAKADRGTVVSRRFGQRDGARSRDDRGRFAPGGPQADQEQATPDADDLAGGGSASGGTVRDDGVAERTGSSHGRGRPGT